MTEGQVLAYVKAAALGLALPLDEERAGRVAMHLARTAAMASELEKFVLEVHQEPAELYSPAPFPVTPHGHKPHDHA